MSLLHMYLRTGHTLEILEEIEKRYRVYRSDPDKPREYDMFAEGQCRAADWILAHPTDHFDDNYYLVAQAALRPRRITPTLALDQIMLDAGKASVLEFVHARAYTRTITGDFSRMKRAILFVKAWCSSKIETWRRAE